MATVTRYFTIVGTGFHSGAWGLISRLTPGTQLVIAHERTNKYDKNAVMILWGPRPLGYLPGGLAATISEMMDLGVDIKCYKANGQGFTMTKTRGKGVAPPLPGVMVLGWDDEDPAFHPHPVASREEVGPTREESNWPKDFNPE
jgi:hypothetical protein